MGGKATQVWSLIKRLITLKTCLQQASLQTLLPFLPPDTPLIPRGQHSADLFMPSLDCCLPCAGPIKSQYISGIKARMLQDCSTGGSVAMRGSQIQCSAPPFVTPVYDFEASVLQQYQACMRIAIP